MCRPGPWAASWRAGRTADSEAPRARLSIPVRRTRADRLPRPDRRARRRDRAAVEPDALAVRICRRGAVLVDADPPPAVRRRAGDRDVATEADEGAGSAGRPRGGIGREVCRERLPGRAEIELDASRDPGRPAHAIEPDRVPTRDGLEPEREGAAAARDQVEVVVVAGQPDGTPDRRVDEPFGRRRGANGCLERVEEERADRDVLAGPGVQPADLAVRAEAAVRSVDITE